MISKPPKHISISKALQEMSPVQMEAHMKYNTPVDDKGRYLHYDDFQYRCDKGLDINTCWHFTKMARRRQSNHLLTVGNSERCRFFLTAGIQRAISLTDRCTTNASLEWMSSNIGEDKHFEYLFNDLVEDEAISSSQLEGAATTTKAAKDLLKSQRKPRTPDEKMIIGNFTMMKFAWENRKKDLTLDLFLELHKIGVEGIDDKKYFPGKLRDSESEVVVADGEGNIIHTLPDANGLIARLEKLFIWANKCHHDADNKTFVHPLVKASALHFAIGYEHPFHDGNGRVARSLFYWYMFKHDFAAFRYIAISTLLKAAPVQYGKSYLYTETDEMDLTYFIDYQCSIVIRAINQFVDAYEKSVKGIEEFNTWLIHSGLYRKLNDKQRVVFQIAKSGYAKNFTTSNVKDNLGCSYNTAASALNGLVDLKLFKKVKMGKQWYFSMYSKDYIKENWVKVK
ncbi:Fic family protein [Shewanella sp. 0m-8]